MSKDDRVAKDAIASVFSVLKPSLKWQLLDFYLIFIFF